MTSRRYAGIRQSTHSASSDGSYDSSHSQHTASTAPTSYSDHKSASKQHPPKRRSYDYEYIEEPPDYSNDRRASVNTYASTTASVEDAEEEHKYSSHVEYASDVISSTPPEFAELFPSARRLLIRHDTTSDGSMNLRVDTEVCTTRGRTLKMTLFHLRMQDLRERKFSLRRYCRDSGREVCSSNKKYAKPVQNQSRRRPTLQRSLTSAIQNLSVKAVPVSMRRNGAGHESEDEEDLTIFDSDQKATIPTNIIKLEFSNYAQVEVERQKTNADKRWAFEYWGTLYFWSRAKHSTTFRLINGLTGKAVARITQEVLSKREAQAESSRGSWCPPCSMMLCDKSVSDAEKADLADVIVATGLIALTDDSIRRLAQ